MEKSRDVKFRGATRFKHSKPKLSSSSSFSGHLGSEEKREKRLRKLSSVVRRSSSSHEDCEMESLSTCREEDGIQSFGGNSSNGKRFKFSEKFVDDCNGVGHASVPRRLRSAMKKRSRDSISPSASPQLSYSKKIKTHMRDVTNSVKMEVCKKSKSNMLKKKRGPQRSSKKRILSGPITKDEEEVAATLFALAGLFADNNTNDESKGNCESSEEPNRLDVPESNDSRPPVFEVAKKHGVASETVLVPSSSMERLPETIKEESWNEPNVQNGPKYTKKTDLPPDNSVSRVTLHSSSAKIEALSDVKPLRNSVEFCAPSNLTSDARLRHSLQNKASFIERNPETVLAMATPIGSQMEPLHKLEDSKKSGLALWPGLPSTTDSKAGRAEDPSLPSSASKLPGWLDTACSGSRSISSIQNDSSAKVLKVTSDRRFPKRCATHVYISRLIQALRISEAEDRSLMPQSQTTTHDGLNPRVSSTIDGVGVGVNGVLSISSINNAIAKQNSNGSNNNGAQQPRSHHDHSHQPAVSKWQNQSFDLFLSLARGGGMEVNDSYRNRVESLPTLQNPYLSSFAQHQPCYNRFSLAQQVQMQLPSYTSQFCSPQTSPTVLEGLHRFQQQQSQHEAHQRLLVAQYRSDETSQFCGAQASPTVTTKHHHLQQQQSQQEAQQRLLVAQYRSDETPKPTIQFLNLQNGPTSQHPVTLSSSPYSGGKVTRQDRHLPLIYEEHNGRFRTSSLVPLQLLCNERR